MDYEKAYKKALERARSYYNDERTRVGMTPIDLEEIFPELKENEDEKIRKAIYSVLKYLETDCSWNSLDEEVNILDAYDWLEKQKKPTWSAEDEHRVKDTIYFLENAKKHYASTIEIEACIYWLNHLKKIGG